MKLFGLLRRGASFFVAGACDKTVSIVTGKKCEFGLSVASQLHDCEPWEDHYETRALNDLRKALKEGDYTSARGLAAFGAKEGASRNCLDMIERLINFVAKGHEPEVYMQEFYSD